MFILKATKAKLKAKQQEIVTSGSVNAYTVCFEFSDDWDGLVRTAVFRAGNESRSVLLSEDNKAVIPWEVLRTPNRHLFCGVYGVMGEDTVLPTVWTDLGNIWQGAEPCKEEAEPPMPNIWEQKLEAKADRLDYDGQTFSLLSGEKVLSEVELKQPVFPVISTEPMDDGTIVTITDADGTHSITLTNGKDGEQGPAGADATINGQNAINIVEGENISMKQDGQTLTISATGGGPSAFAAKLQIYFGAEFDGQNYMVMGGDGESYSGTVPDSLVETVTVSALGTPYTVVCQNSSGVEYTRVFTTGNFSGVYTAYFKDQSEFTPSAGIHNGIFRGKYLGAAVTPAQYAAIKAGTFDDLYIGDYWTIDGVNWRIAHFDYWLHTGDDNEESVGAELGGCKDHHAVIVPDSYLYIAQMNTQKVTTGAYVGSAMRGNTNGAAAGNLTRAITQINAAFGAEHVLQHREYLHSAVTNGYASAAAWLDSTVELMNEPMVYGSYICAPAGNGTQIVHRATFSKSQLALFQMAPDLIITTPMRRVYWLRDVVSSANFARVDYRGSANHGSASDNSGVRPVFAIYEA